METHMTIEMHMITLNIFTGFVFKYFGSVLVYCRFNILLTEAGVMHRGVYVYSIWSTYYHFPFWISCICPFWIMTSCPLFHYLGSPLSYHTLIFDIMRNLYLYWHISIHL